MAYLISASIGSSSIEYLEHLIVYMGQGFSYLFVSSMLVFCCWEFSFWALVWTIIKWKSVDVGWRICWSVENLDVDNETLSF